MGFKPRKNDEKVDRRKILKADRAKPETGQSGPPMELLFDNCNRHEQKVLICLDAVDHREPVNVAQIHKATKLIKLYIRNAMRRLVRANWVENVEEVAGEKARGYYRLTKVGKDRMRRAKGKAAGPKSNGQIHAESMA